MRFSFFRELRVAFHSLMRTKSPVSYTHLSTPWEAQIYRVEVGSGKRNPVSYTHLSNARTTSVGENKTGSICVLPSFA